MTSAIAVPATAPVPVRGLRLALQVLAGVVLLGLVSGLWIYVTYPAWHGVRVSFGDAFGSGVMDWGLWAPFLPLAAWIAGRLGEARVGFARTLAAEVVAAALVSLAQLTLFALASVVLRALLYEQDPTWTRLDILEVSLASAFQVKFKTGVLLALLVFAVLHARAAWAGLRERVEPVPGPPAAPMPSALAEPLPIDDAPLREEPGPAKLVASAGGRTVLLDFDEIDWVEAAGNYLRLHVSGNVHLTRGTLHSFLERARARGFVRVHRSALVRAATIASVSAAGSGDLELELRDGTTLRASRRFRAAIDELLGNGRPSARPAGEAARPGNGNESA
jgi:hypothetical protein